MLTPTLERRWVWRDQWNKMNVYPLGTSEYLQIELVSTTPDPEGVNFTIKNKDTGDEVVAMDAGEFDPLTRKCLYLMTTAGWDVGTYQAFVTLILDVEDAIIGPYEFIVN